MPSAAASSMWCSCFRAEDVTDVFGHGVFAESSALLHALATGANGLVRQLLRVSLQLLGDGHIGRALGVCEYTA